MRFEFFSQKKVAYEKSIDEIAGQESMKSEEIIKEKSEETVIQEPVAIDSREKTEKKEAEAEKNIEQEKVQPKVESKKESEDKNNNDNIGKIVDKLMSSGFQKSSDRKIDTVIVHTSYNAIGSDPYDVDDIIKQYRQYEVSAHYLIGRSGIIYRLVDEKNIAWHAGVSKMPDGRTNINDFSIGIEVVNTNDGKFTDDQYDALNSLVGNLKKKYPIKNILGHDDIAPGRKTDPWGIDWKKVDR